MFTRGADKQDDGFKTKPEYTGSRLATAGKLDPKIVKAFKGAETEKGIVRRIETPEVLTKKEGAEMDMREEKKSILAQVSKSMACAQVGQFHALMAGIGLSVIKAYCAHGEYEKEIAVAFPERSRRSLQNYRKMAEQFLEARGITARDAWLKLSAVEYGLLNRAAGQLMLGDGTPTEEPPLKKKEIPGILLDMCAFLNREDDNAPKSEDEEKPDKMLTKSEMLKGAKALWEKMVSQITDETMKNNSFAVLPLETQKQSANLLEGAAAWIKKSVAKVEKATQKKGAAGDE